MRIKAAGTAGLRDREDFRIGTVAAVNELGDTAAEETARELAARLGATVADRPGQSVDLIVVGSRTGASPGHVTISAAVRYLIETVSAPVLVVPAATVISFGPPG